MAKLTSTPHVADRHPSPAGAVLRPAGALLSMAGAPLATAGAGRGASWRAWLVGPERLRIETLVGAFVILGCLLRLGRYLLCFPLWGDESMLAQNFLERGYAELMQPLAMHQIAPVAFLWIELTAVKLLGFSEWSLRLFPLLAGLSSVLLFRHLAGRLLDRVPLLLAVGIFCVSYYPIRHVAECKPYASDLTASLLLMTLAVRWWQAPGERRWLWALAIAGPLAIAVSYPTVFVAGGISLTLALPVLRSRDGRSMLAFAAYNVLLAAMFLTLLRLVSGAQYAASRDFMLGYWAGGFPPANPLALLGWLMRQHCGEMMAYPVGDDHFGSTLTLLCFVAGVGVLLRRRQTTIACLLISPLALALVAAALRRYPYGGARLAQYYGPSICLAAGLGAAALIAALRPPQARRATLRLATAVLFLVGTVSLARDMTRPYKHLVDYQHRGFARWFWIENAAEAEVVCLRTDLKKNFFPSGQAENYLCYQRLYSPLHRRGGRSVDLLANVPQRPLRCVVYGDLGVPRDEKAFDAWLREMGGVYDLTGHQAYRVRLDGDPSRMGCYEVYEFRPKASAVAAEASPDRR